MLSKFRFYKKALLQHLKFLWYSYTVVLDLEIIQFIRIIV